MIQIKEYKILNYCLRSEFENIIDYDRLEYIHFLGGFENVGDKPGSDNCSWWHKKFYSEMRDSDFMFYYSKFISNEILPQFNEPIVYQKYPTLRISIPEGKGVAAYHIDSDYNHPVNEINIWLPFTDAFDTNSIYIESEPNKGDYKPQNVKYGQFITFEGGILKHGNEVNKTGVTRVSIDFRIIPQSKFQESDLKGLAYGKVRSTKGEDAYYAVM